LKDTGVGDIFKNCFYSAGEWIIPHALTSSLYSLIRRHCAIAVFSLEPFIEQSMDQEHAIICYQPFK